MIVYTDWPVALLDFYVFCLIFWLASVVVQTAISVYQLTRKLEDYETNTTTNA